jgi:hypothetical protein
MKFYAFNNRDKCDRYIAALTEVGHQLIEDPEKAEFLLLDVDRKGLWPLLNRAHARGCKVFMYPHAARSVILWDGIYAVWPHTACNFVFGEGQRTVMGVYGYPIPTSAVGWGYSDFKVGRYPHKDINVVVFAPIHPNSKSVIREEDQRLNAMAFEILMEMQKKYCFELVVRYGDELEANGLKFEPIVTYRKAKYLISDSLADIDSADLIISYDTFGYLAIASGVPTLLFGQEHPGHNMTRVAQHWNDYKEIMAYPLDLFGEYDREYYFCGQEQKLVENSLECWRQLFLGGPFRKQKFIEKVEEHLQ